MKNKLFTLTLAVIFTLSVKSQTIIIGGSCLSQTYTLNYTGQQYGQNSYSFASGPGGDNLDVFWWPYSSEWVVTGQIGGMNVDWHSPIQTSPNPPNFSIGNWYETLSNGCALTQFNGTGTCNGPLISATSSSTLLCTGQTATLTASGANTYTWSNGSTGSNIAVSPTVTTTYTVIGTNTVGCSNTDSITQSVSICAGITQIDNVNNEINIYPNPSNGIFNIDAVTSTNLIVYNTLGAIVVNKIFESGSHQLNLTNQTNGIYFVKVIRSDKQQTIRLIKE